MSEANFLCLKGILNAYNSVVGGLEFMKKKILESYSTLYNFQFINCFDFAVFAFG